MSIFDDERPKKPAAHEIGCDLTFMSSDELKNRITLLKEEIERLEIEAAKKLSGRDAAENLFRTKS